MARAHWYHTTYINIHGMVQTQAHALTRWFVHLLAGSHRCLLAKNDDDGDIVVGGGGGFLPHCKCLHCHSPNNKQKRNNRSKMCVIHECTAHTITHEPENFYWPFFSRSRLKFQHHFFHLIWFTYEMCAFFFVFWSFRAWTIIGVGACYDDTSKNSSISELLFSRILMLLIVPWTTQSQKWIEEDEKTISVCVMCVCIWGQLKS